MSDMQRIEGEQFPVAVDVVAHPNNFRLEFDLDVRGDWPPFSVETLWVGRVEGDRYWIKNVPFFAKGIAFGDVVRAHPKVDDPSMLALDEVVDRSGHSVVRVIVQGDHVVRECRAVFTELGCDTELSNFPKLFSVDIPVSVGFDRAVVVLDEGVSDGRWDYEDGFIAE